MKAPFNYFFILMNIKPCFLHRPGDEEKPKENKWEKEFAATKVSKEMALPLQNKKKPIDDNYARWLEAWGPVLRE